MGSLRRKFARNKAKKAKKRMAEQISMFGAMGKECAACQKPFDKKCKEQVATWNVVVREKENIVRLYCPECWNKANKLIEEIQDDIRDRSERGSEVSKQSESE